MDEETRKAIMEVKADLEKIRSEVTRAESMSYFDESELMNIGFEITNLVDHATKKLEALLGKRNSVLKMIFLEIVTIAVRFGHRSAKPFNFPAWR